MFYNTIELQSEPLAKARAQAATQQKKILAFFESHAGSKFTPSEIAGALFLWNAPVTSIRRAMTDLTKAGLLEKTSTRKAGPYGKPEHCWRLAEDVVHE